MPFRFPLQSLLRFRQSVERRQELRLQEANLQVAQVEREIELFDRRESAIMEERRQELRQGTTGAQLQFHQAVTLMMSGRREALKEELTRRRRLQVARLDELLLARRQREAVATLYQSQLHAYRQQEGRRQQSRLDDLFLLRRHYHGRL